MTPHALAGPSIVTVLDALGEIVWLRRPTGEMYFINKAAEAALGIHRSEFAGDPDAHLRHIHPEDRDAVLAAGRAAENGSVEVEFRVALPESEPRWFKARLLPLHDHEDRTVAVMGIGHEMAIEVRPEHLHKKLVHAEGERDRAESSAHELRSILDRITDGFFALDREWRFLYVNRRFVEILGRDAREVTGKSIFETYPDFGGSIFHQQYERALREGRTVEFEIMWEPSRAWYEIHAYPSTEGVSVFFQDLTEKRRLELELVEATARERQRVGAELHDSVGQKLTGASLLVSALEARLTAGEALDPAELGTIGKVLGDLIAETRRISRGLFPAELEGQTLPAALEGLAEDVEELFGASCRTHASPGIRFAPETEVHLLRIAQELITNAVKHGGAEQVDLGLRCTRRGVEMSVSHDGSSPAPGRDEPGGMGLRSLRFRAQAIGASLETEPAGDRTRTTCRLPL